MKRLFNRRIGAYLFDLGLLLLAFMFFDLFSFKEKSPEVFSLTSYINELGNYYKQINTKNILIILLNILYTSFYFVIWPYFHNGQTLGKKIFKIRVKMMGGRELTLKSFLIRSLITSGLFYYLGLLLGLFISVNYFILISIFGLIQMFLLIICLIMVITIKDQRGIHDILAHTRVMIAG